MQAEARAVRLALSAFSAILPSTMDVWVDNTSLQGAANKGSPKSHALIWELQQIYGFLGSRRIQAFFAYVRSAENPADGLSRGRVLRFRTWRRGAAVSFGWRTPKVCQFVSNKYFRSYLSSKGHVGGQRNIYIYYQKKTLRQLTASSIPSFFLSCLIS
ncbi:putative target of rapamycin (TOR) kinase 1 [Trypanosoma cruzi]|uniref:Putative target of rapamycin (TOR) kinase 1 n=1 Tax=Trypanosoma cruzi TaxID=5693 RepID=A0A2V2X6U3_TRYCR|nr:putative target of rapamycin (TOR) kinase 1 [Trypanosoma cruzi]